MIGKCFDCKKRRKLYTLLVDPDIDVENRCKDCMDKFKEKLLIKFMEIDEKYNK